MTSEPEDDFISGTDDPAAYNRVAAQRRRDVTSELNKAGLEAMAKAMFEVGSVVSWETAVMIASSEPDSAYVRIVPSYRTTAEKAARAYLSASHQSAPGDTQTGLRSTGETQPAQPAEAEGLEVVGWVKPDHPVVVDQVFVRTRSRPWMNSVFTEAVILKSAADARITALQAEVERLTKERDTAHRIIALSLNARAMEKEFQRTTTAEASLAAARQQIDALREALEPSAGTKAAYIGEFTIAVERHVDEDDEVDDETEGHADPYEHITVPWTTIKQIMAAIRARAAIREHE